MSSDILSKAKLLSKRFVNINDKLSDPQIIADLNVFRELSIESASLVLIHEAYLAYCDCKRAIEESLAFLKEDEINSDKELKDLAKEELTEQKEVLKSRLERIITLLAPKEKANDRNTILEIRAGTGGGEATLFCQDLLRMYLRYAEKKGWSQQLIHSSSGELGIREVLVRFTNPTAYECLRFESGTHRVQRIRKTETNGRLHTSACTVAVMPEVKHIEEINLDMSEVRIDTYKASGAGGQHVNKTDSAVRATHLPTGTVAESQSSRSQHKNRIEALSLLASKLLAEEQKSQQNAQNQERKSLVGSGDRSERVRTYNFPQSRITDHRINMSLYKLHEIMDGDLDELTTSLSAQHKAMQITHTP